MIFWVGGGGGGFGVCGGCLLLFDVFFGFVIIEIKEICFIFNVRKNYWNWKEWEKERNLFVIIFFVVYMDMW